MNDSKQVDVAQFAARQLRDYDAHRPGTLFSEPAAIDLEMAYLIQREVCRLRQQRGERLMGYKVGCTSPTIRERLGVAHPVFGRLFASEC